MKSPRPTPLAQGGESKDRELLERAARAAGLSSHRYCEPWNAMAHYTMQDGYFGESWNPLTNDGDALRLAAKLPEPISIDLGVGTTIVSGWTVDCSEPHGDDPMAATRRAIVRAAAAMAPDSAD